MCDDNTTMLAPSAMPTGPGCPVASPTRTAGAPAPRSGSGAAALPKPATEPACGARQAGDTMARVAPFVERRYVFTGNGVFVCKTNVRQQGTGEVSARDQGGRVVGA
jgi:hypothetical protein